MRRLRLMMLLLFGCAFGLLGSSSGMADEHEEAAAEVSDEIEELEEVDEVDEESAYDFRGLFVRAGYAYASFDEDESNIDFDDAMGFAVAVGWRHSAWAALELTFAGFYGSETDDYQNFDRVPVDDDDTTKSLTSSEFAVNAKLYPLGIDAVRDLRESPLLSNLPEIIQPYVGIGLGYSLQDVGKSDQTRPAFRFVGGIDVIVWEPIAITLEGGYTRHEHLVRRNRGTHIEGTKHLNVGVTLRF